MRTLTNGMYVHCETEEQAKKFIEEAYKQGFEWKVPPTEFETYWHEYEKNTYYSLNYGRITFGDINICPEVLNEKGWRDKIIKFEDLEV